jgi:VanZ family protein
MNMKKIYSGGFCLEKKVPVYLAKEAFPAPKPQARSAMVSFRESAFPRPLQKKELTISLPFYIGAGILIILGTVPGDAMPLSRLLWQWGRPAHFLEYLVFSVLLFRFLRLHGSGNLKRSLMIMIWVSIILAVLDEVHQIPIPSRNFDLRDLAADLAGITMGFVMVCTFSRTLRFLPGRRRICTLPHGPVTRPRSFSRSSFVVRGTAQGLPRSLSQCC